MIQYLNWDSVFFDIKTGRINFTSDLKLEDALRLAQNEGYKLIYVFGDKDFFLKNDLLERFNGKLVDRKIVFEKDIYNTNILDTTDIVEYKSTEINEALVELALESGKYSRFKLDKNFKNSDFERMYSVWITKSVEKKNADYVFVAKSENNIVGMITLTIENNYAHIGLIAILADQQGKGYGKKLMNKCIETAFINNCEKIQVPTQLDNNQACLFYKSCDFNEKNITNIYHFWLKG